MTRSHAFSRALRQPHVITSSFDWFNVLSVSYVIDQSNYFGFGFTTLKRKPLYNNLRVKFYTQIFLICVHFLVYLCMYIFTQVFHECFSRGICVQYGGFPRMKHACNAAMPVACTVLVQRSINLIKSMKLERLSVCVSISTNRIELLFDKIKNYR